MTDDLRRRLEAVERAVTDRAVEEDAASTPTPGAADELAAVSERLDDLERRLDDLEAGLQAVRGYVGSVRAVNEDVERRANVAVAKVEAVERRLEPPNDTGEDTDHPVEENSTEDPKGGFEARSDDDARGDADARGGRGARSDDDARGEDSPRERQDARKGGHPDTAGHPDAAAAVDLDEGADAVEVGGADAVEVGGDDDGDGTHTNRTADGRTNRERRRADRDRLPSAVAARSERVLASVADRADEWDDRADEWDDRPSPSSHEGVARDSEANASSLVRRLRSVL